MTTVAKTSMISKNSTTGMSLFLGAIARAVEPAVGSREFDDRDRWPRGRSGDLDVHLVDARARRCHHGVAVAHLRQRAQRP